MRLPMRPSPANPIRLPISCPPLSFERPRVSRSSLHPPTASGARKGKLSGERPSAVSSVAGWRLPSSSAVAKVTFPVASITKAWLGNATKADSSSPSIPSTVTS